MTTPIGDLPDWQTLVTPQVVPNVIFDQTGNVAALLRRSVNPYRVWGVWIAVTISTNGSYVTGTQLVDTKVQDGSAVPLLACSVRVIAALDYQVVHLAIPLPGVTPSLLGGFYDINLVTGVSSANTAYTASAGILTSQP